MTFLSAMTAYLSAVRTSRALARSRMFASELPIDLRKDIGWPDNFAGQTRARRRAAAAETPQ